MTTTVVQLLAPFQGGQTGQVMGLSNATATALVASGGAVLYNQGLGAGIPNLPAGGYQAQWAGEATSVFLNRVPGGQPNPSKPIRAIEANPQVTVRGHLEAPDLTY